MSPAVREDLIAYLIAVGWEAAQKFDGRGRLAGYMVTILHFRATDFLRAEYGEKRGAPRPEFVEFDPEHHTVPAHDDYPHEQNGRHLDRSSLSPRSLDQLALLELVIEEDSTVTATARQLGVSNDIERLRAEARIVGS